MTVTAKIRITAIIGMSFLLSSTGWLSWEYHLLKQIPAGMTDICTMVFGYLLQAAGIGVFAVILRRKSAAAAYPEMIRLIRGVLILHMVCMIPAVSSPYAAGTLVFGMFMNLFCGILAGYYLYALAKDIPGDRKAIVFGLGYGLSILVQWLISLAGGGTFYYSGKVLIVCLILTAALFAVIRPGTLSGSSADSADMTAGQNGLSPAKAKYRPPTGNLILSVCLLVLLFSIVNSCGFTFPSSDIGQNVNVEFTRLMYAAGLILAGFVSDRDRKYGAVCALAALMIPFIILALQGEIISSVIFWLLSYFIFGFYSVFRIILLSDIASGSGLLFLSGFGLMTGRIGDAAGEVICILFTEHFITLVILTACLFAVSVALFFRLYPILYVPGSDRQQSEKEKFLQFSAAHDLSARERDMLRLLLEGKTNAEIADSLSISENTVKYHIRNLLQKTGCKNRKDLLTVYVAWFQS